MTTSPAGQAGSLVLDAEALYRELLRGVRSMLTPTTRLAGIASGGAWLAERLQKDLGLEGPAGVLSSVMHRDDFAQRGLSAGAQTSLPFDVNGADVLVLDDVLYTGRTIRAVLNELFDYGRPASVTLAVLVDRGGRELPIAAAYAAAKLALPAQQPPVPRSVPLIYWATAMLLLGDDLAARKPDLAASTQAAIVEVLLKKSMAALRQTGLRRLVVAGGVGANRELRQRLNAACQTARVRVHYPELHLCTDNGAMIAMAAAMRLQAGRAQAGRDYSFDVRPRWPLDAIDA